MTTAGPIADSSTSNATSECIPNDSMDMPGLSWILFGHAAFQYLNAGAELGLFELVYDRSSATKSEIAYELSLEERAVDVLLLGCTSLGLLTIDVGGYRLAGVMRSLVAAPDDWRRFKDTVAFEQYVVYEGQLDFTESLRTNSNAGLRRIPGTGRDLYHRLSENPHLESVFFRYMRSWSEIANQHLVATLDLQSSERLLDCGGGDAVNAIALAVANPHLHVDVLDIEDTVDIAQRKIDEAGVSDRVSVIKRDFLSEQFPDGYDVVLFAHQLVIWTLDQNTDLLKKAHSALRGNGRVVIFNSMSNDAGDGPIAAALDSVYFATLPAEGGMIYSWAQHEECLEAAGFINPHRVECSTWTPHGIIIAEKVHWTRLDHEG